MTAAEIKPSKNSKNNGEAPGAGWFCFHFQEFIGNGFVIFDKLRIKILITVRGMCMIDVFVLENLQHIAFLDFDLSRSAALDSAFASPLIGLPFSATVHRTIGKTITPFLDLRTCHHVGFFVERDYRNGGSKGLWNLDELMMAAALELAFEQGAQRFVIKPTNDKLKYYRRKYDARVMGSTGNDRLVGIHIPSARRNMQHIRYVQEESRSNFHLCVTFDMD